MAQIQYGPLISDARGSVRGVTFSRACGGSTVRGRPRPSLAASTNQRLIQSFIARTSWGWKQLTAEFKASWTVYASTVTLLNRFGLPFTPTGQMMWTRAAMFQKIWSYWNGSEMSWTTAAPTESGLPPAPIFIYSFDGGDLSVVSCSNPPLAGDNWMVSFSIPVTSSVFSGRRLQGYFASTGEIQFPQIIASQLMFPYPHDHQYFVTARASIAPVSGNRISNTNVQLLMDNY